MFRSYLQIAVRNISKHRFFTLLNAFGLALAMSFSLLFISFYSFVSSFDDFHGKKESIYRVISTLDDAGYASAPGVLANRLKEEASGIKEVVRINSSFHGDIVSDRLNLPVTGYYADENFFAVFDFKMTQGNPATALSRPNSIVLTQTLARKIDPSGNLIGRILQIDGRGNFEVTGVIEDQRRTHLWFEALVSFNILPIGESDQDVNRQWTVFSGQYIYLLLNGSSGRESTQRYLDGVTAAIAQQLDAKVTFSLQPLGDITPGPDLEDSIGADSDYTLIVVFGTICLLILVPACFNYANLSIARALKRSKEIGLRKTLGSSSKQIAIQFIIETLAIVTLALIGALLIFMMIRPEFEDMMPGAWLDLSLTWEMLAAFVLFAFTTGLLTGVFPALYFAGLNPIQALKGKVNAKGNSRIGTRKVLVVFQFGLSFCFMLLLMVFSRQYRANLNFDYGFDTKDILNVELQDAGHARFRTEFTRLSAVQNISMSSGILGLSYTNTIAQEEAGGDSIEVAQFFSDGRFIENMGLDLLAGREFNEESGQSENQIIVNEEFLRHRQIASPMDALGKVVLVEGKELVIIGVLKNFHFAPLQLPIESFFLRMDPSQFRYANLKIASNGRPDVLATMEKVWAPLSGRKFEARFFDDDMSEIHHFYLALVKMIGFLGLIAVSITLLGLLGMVIYTIEPRIKEVGIRKVFGADDSGIIYLLSKDFIYLMAWAAGVAIPASILLIDDLLSQLQYYHISLSTWDVLSCFAVFALIGVCTIVSQTRTIAKANPIDTLRYE